MARVPETEIERLKEEISLERLVEASGVELAKQGSDLVGRCPFHEDHTPSLVISPAKNLWHCLGACDRGGSVIDWVMASEGVSFRHAVELLRDGVAPSAPARGRPPRRSTSMMIFSPRCQVRDVRSNSRCRAGSWNALLAFARRPGGAPRGQRWGVAASRVRSRCSATGGFRASR